MEKLKRTQFQGVSNIVRFNWHFYLIALLVLISIFFINSFIKDVFYQKMLFCAIFLLVFTIIVSLSVSYYIYDYSGFYNFDWLQNIDNTGISIVNINAGFDETSEILSQKFPNAKLSVFDFYDEKKHTEISIERARKAYPPFPNTIKIDTSNIPIQANSVDVVFLILAAHEIRNEEERTLFFCELAKGIKKDGKIIVVEHLRDSANFCAFTIGFFHFYSLKNWKKVFEKANLNIQFSQKITPFIQQFTLEKNEHTS